MMNTPKPADDTPGGPTDPDAAPKRDDAPGPIDPDMGGTGPTNPDPKPPPPPPQ